MIDDSEDVIPETPQVSNKKSEISKVFNIHVVICYYLYT